MTPLAPNKTSGIPTAHIVILSGARSAQSKDLPYTPLATAVRTFLPTRFASLALVLGLAFSSAPAQPPNPTDPQPAQSVPDSSQPITPSGKILFSRDATTPPDSQPTTPPPTTPQPDTLAVTDAERSALTFTAYDLDLHLTPASAGISVRAALTVRNDSAAPLRRLILDITSTTHWDSFSTRTATSAVTHLPFATHIVSTDADHSGGMSEAVITLPQPLAPGASLTLTALYSGTIPEISQRLIDIGAPAAQALSEDWDAIAPNNPDAPAEGTALRGFGYVLWYPVSAPPVFLGDGARLFQAVGQTKLRESAATFRLRLAVEYVGEPPDAAFFCGYREQLLAISDNPNVPVAESPGIATATFDPQPLGFRMPSLFITGHAATDVGTQANPGLIAAITARDDALLAYSAAAALVEPLLTDWFGPHPLTALTILDRPGEPFEDDALLVTDLARTAPTTDPTALAPALAHSLTHAWIHSGRPWIDEGLAEFVTLLWTERSAGRAAALSQLQGQARTLALAEPEVPTFPNGPTLSAKLPPQSSSSPNPSAGPTPTVTAAGASLADATGEVFYRTKAAAVWWMLRSIVGDNTLKQSLQAYRKDPKLDRDPAGLEHILEQLSHQDLKWFFDNWVYQDRGLPDLTIVNVTPSQLETRNGLPSGWLVAVEVHNDGYAEAEVPVTVRSATATETHLLRIPGRISASTRIVFAGTPQQVQVNDGSVPETQTSIHTRQLVLPER
ncbi:MAG: hypothetical protein ABSG84_12980 [Acidobacteriaceae bacterium]